MLLRFSLYGFLKNQRYFEPFLVLFFLDRGLTFFQIGLLIGLRELAVNVLEVPSGALADIAGRRRAMVFAFSAYAISLVVFGLARSLPLLVAAMLLYSVGEAFRSGTHKAMIFRWLELQDRLSERTRVYGQTRSWSQIGSAMAAPVGAVIMITTGSYSWLFFCALVPYAVNLANLATYPEVLDSHSQEARQPPTLEAVVSQLRAVVSQTMKRTGLRRLVLEAASFEGIFASVKGYLQPLLAVIAATSLASSRGAWLPANSSAAARDAPLVGLVYFLLFLGSAVASRKAHHVVESLGSEDQAARRLWWFALGLYAGVAWGAAFLPVLAVGALAALHIVQNVWRPILVSRLDEHSDAQHGATVLSIESQARKLTTLVVAPALGFVIDALEGGSTSTPFWPIGLLGGCVAFVFVCRRPSVKRDAT